MTDTPRPLTADEIAAIETWAASYFSPPFQHMAHGYFQRLIATIEQQAEQIKQLREALTRIARMPPLIVAEPDGTKIRFDEEIKIAREALAATEPS